MIVMWLFDTNNIQIVLEIISLHVKQSFITFAEADIVSGGNILVRSAEAIREAYVDTDEDLREALDMGENPIIDIRVSFDRIWQKRGFTSL